MIVEKRVLKRKILVLGLLLIGLILIFNAQILNWVTNYESAKYGVKNESAKLYKVNNQKTGNFDYSSVKVPSTTQMAKHVFDKTRYPVIGGIAVPALKISLPIFKGVGFDEMMYGAGTLQANQVMGQGNYALASHNVFNQLGQSDGKTLFSPLIHAHLGQRIYLTDRQAVYVYQVDQINNVSQYDLAVLNQQGDKHQVTLLTCLDASATKRIVVVGDLIKVESFNQKTAAYFEN